MSLEHLRAIREYEIKLILPLLTRGQRILEIGSGAGWQAQALTRHGFTVTTLDVIANDYPNSTTTRRCFYDGVHIPLRSGSVDVVYSSNVLEHIRPMVQIQAELRRVLKAGGRTIHVLPTTAWRFWTLAAFYARKARFPDFDLFPERHGEVGNTISELYLFSTTRWCRLFRATGWIVESVMPNRLFYTGHSVLDRRLPLPYRHLLSQYLGSACTIYVLR